VRIPAEKISKTGLSLLLLFLLAATACHPMRFEMDEGPAYERVYDRKSFFLWGLVPTRKVDVSEHGPHGAVAVREETTFVDGLLNTVTLGIYTPRSSWYYCKAEEGSP